MFFRPIFPPLPVAEAACSVQPRLVTTVRAIQETEFPVLGSESWSPEHLSPHSTPGVVSPEARLSTLSQARRFDPLLLFNPDLHPRTNTLKKQVSVGSSTRIFTSNSQILSSIPRLRRKTIILSSMKNLSSYNT